MKKFYFIGIDVSKKKLDFCVLSDGAVINEGITRNRPGDISRLLKSLKQGLNASEGDLLVCAEHTGQYTYPLTIACTGFGCPLWLENPSQIKFSSGVHRGKNDKVDARRIAVYASRFVDRARLPERPTAELERLKQLVNERKLYRVDLAKYKGQLTDQKKFMESSIYAAKAGRVKSLIHYLEGLVKKIDREIEAIVSSSERLSRQVELLTTIEGVGKTVALASIIETEAFTRFDDPRKFACHAGVAPFQYTSGSSQHSRNRVSQRANKRLKTLFHMAALAITRKKTGELKKYYERKVKEGKNKMTVINAIRAKIIARMFAVIKRNEEYKQILSFSPL